MSVWLALLLTALGVVGGLVVGLTLGRRGTTTDEAPDDGAATVAETEVPRPGTRPVASAALVEQMRPAAVVVTSGDDVVLANTAARDGGVVRHGRLAVRALLELSREVRRTGPLTRDIDLPRALGRGPGRVLGVEGVLLDDEGTVGLVLHDVTEARRLEAVRRDFVANVSHELKTPVGALTILAEAVEDAANDPDAVRRFAGRMHHESRRLGRLVREVIDLSRLQGGDPMPPFTDVRVAGVVAEACDRTRLAADTRGIDIVHHGDLDLVVPAVESQVSMAVSNLLSNAVAYSQPGTKVAVGYRARDGYAEITVTDEGIGIPSRDLARIFERFYRVDPARSSATGGTGLGLSIVKHVATNHGGSVDVWSVEGQGSTFTLRLPLAGPPDDGTGPDAIAPSDTSDTSDTSTDPAPVTAVPPPVTADVRR